MKNFDWNKEKNEWLKRERNISFEEIANALTGGKLLDVIDHYNLKRYPNRQIIIVKVRDYAYMVPFVEDENKVFFKTIIPSRKATKIYILEGGVR